MYELKLYIAGISSDSIELFEKLEAFFKKRLNGNCFIKLIDLLKNPESAEIDKIFATPTLIKKKPEPIKSVIGDLSNIERVYLQLIDE